MDSGLIHYTKRQIASGKDHKEIKSMLMQVGGWSHDDASTIMEKAHAAHAAEKAQQPAAAPKASSSSRAGQIAFVAGMIIAIGAIAALIFYFPK